MSGVVLDCSARPVTSWKEGVVGSAEASASSSSSWSCSVSSSLVFKAGKLVQRRITATSRPAEEDRQETMAASLHKTITGIGFLLWGRN